MRDRIRRRYGSIRRWVSYLDCGVRHRLGLISFQRDPDWSRVERLVFACRGNICRSAYAEARARNRGLNAVSVGLDAASGSMADVVAIEVAQHRGVDLAIHRSRRVEELGAHPGDLWLCMEPSHFAEVQARLGAPVVSTMLGYWTREGNPMIPDPYGTIMPYFDHCFDRIDAAVAALVNDADRERSACLLSPKRG